MHVGSEYPGEGESDGCQDGRSFTSGQCFFYRDDYWNDHRLRWRILPRNPRRSKTGVENSCKYGLDEEYRFTDMLNPDESKIS